MRIRNETHWNTADLRKLFMVAFAGEGVKHRGYLIRINNARQKRYCSGYAIYNSRRMWLCLPKNDLPMVDLTQTFIHELGHCLGLRHREMAKVGSIDVGWVAGMRIRKDAPAPVATRLLKPKADIKIARFDKAQRMLAKHASKLKRQQKLVKKWKAKVKYYERTFERAASNGKDK